jgi:hypothetical protein
MHRAHSFLLALGLAALHGPPAEADPSAPISGPQPPYAHAVGEVHTDFAAPDQDGASFVLSGQVDKVVLLHLCTLWCTACRDSAMVEAALISGIDAVVGAGNWLLVDALVQDNAGSPSDQLDAQNWRQVFGTPARTVHADGDIDSAILALGNTAMAFPLYVVIDRDGVVAALEFGFTPATTPQLLSGHVIAAWETRIFRDGFEGAPGPDRD